ncbi:SRPBCC domain-containing protein [Nubsella zeaxanthinifaciens]|uniref:SRPBCC domain-containing protein n=1 Tax=Nubsella zeaxanthinifaciens TaxID=392412 RepID=UPI000DE276D1|nr:SRPBCC domain-containing protein [Nubsella zeaxanthinifaciens]
MQQTANQEVLSSRVIEAPVNVVYDFFAKPALLKTWWGPEGFTNTIHEFDLKPGGKWILTMHGPEKGNYENSAVFTQVVPQRLVAWTRLSQPLFDMEVGFEELGNDQTRISFKMIFASVEECEKMRKFVAPKNEENFDRLQRAIQEGGQL